MYVLKKNQIVVTALVIMIVVAGYLNYSDRKNVAQNEELVINQSELFNDEFVEGNTVPNEDTGQPKVVNPTAVDSEEKKPEIKDSVAEPKTDENLKTNEKDSKEPTMNTDEFNDSSEAMLDANEEVVSVQSGAVANYFAEAKLNRENVRAKYEQKLKDMIGNKDFPKDEKQKAAQTLLDLQTRIEKEAAAETLIKGKGFKQVFVRLNDDYVDVIVDKAELSEAEAAQISDIITRTTKVSADKIRISRLKVKN